MMLSRRLSLPALPALRRRSPATRWLARAPPASARPSSSSSAGGASPQTKSAEPSEPAALGSLALLEQSIARRQAARALTLFGQLEQLPSPLILQKLAALLSKQPSRAYSSRAFDLLLSVYRIPGFCPDDYTRLASIHVIESCLRHGQVDRAMELYDEAFNQGVSLDLGAYDALLAALVDNGRVDEAAEVLQDIAGHRDASPSEFTYQPVLLSLARDREYHRATELLQQGAERGVKFTTETFLPLIEAAEADEDATDALVMFLSYIEEHWAEAKFLEDMAAELDKGDEDGDNRME